MQYAYTQGVLPSSSVTLVFARKVGRVVSGGVRAKCFVHAFKSVLVAWAPYLGRRGRSAVEE